jgi:SNF5 / SMARCB1 / INI1
VVTLSSSDETLIPIWLDMKIGGTCIEERFLWSSAETKLTPFQFARDYCIDMDIPDNSVEPIRKEIERQIQVCSRSRLLCTHKRLLAHTQLCV